MTEFDFEEDDTVLIRIKRGGSLKAKMVAKCVEIHDSPTQLGSQRGVFQLGNDHNLGPLANRVKLRPHDAEFEVVDSHHDVHF